MNFKVKFSETDQSLKVKFGEVCNVSDGGYERGLEEGYTKGEADGHAAGYAEGYAEGEIKGKAEGVQIGYDKALSEGYIKPSGTIEITENNKEYDVASYEKANVSIPNKLAQVVDRSVTEITAEDLAGATNIASYVFYNRLNLKSVTIPEGVKAIYTNAFNMSYNIRSINILSTVLTTIDAYAFGYIHSTAEINLPDSVTTIGSSAFYSCGGLQRVSIGSGITKIDSSAFSNCKVLKELIVLAEEPPTIQANTFNNVPADCIIKVRASSVDKYKTATNWSVRADYIVAIEG